MLTIRAMSNGEGYAARHLAHSDYYAEGERIVGQWFGRGAGLLNLAGEVQPEHFEPVREGRDPFSGEFLRQRRSADRMAADGSIRSHGRNLYDFTFSAPKSVSIVAELTADVRLVQAHQNAVIAALSELESYAATGVRRAGASHDRTTGNLVLAVYHHDTSRELDPQLHTHAVAANLTWDGTENRWKALQAHALYERRAYLTEVYRNHLAYQIRVLGYDVEVRRDAKGRDLGFEIRGVSEELILKYSQRSQQRDRAIAEFIAVHGRPPSNNEVAILVRETRAAKLTEIATAEVKARQRARLEPGEAARLQTIRAAAGCGNHDHGFHNPLPSLHYAEDHFFERVSVAHDYQILTEALRHGRGRIDLGQLQGALHLQQTTGHILRAGTEIATQASLERERQMIAAINSDSGQLEPLSEQLFTASDRLRPEQKHAVEFILHSRDRAVNLRGAAGTGKTVTLQEIHRGLQEAGRQVLAVAPSMSAVEVLQKVGFTNAQSVERLLQDRQVKDAAAGKVLIVDEAGMVSGRQMLELLALAQSRSLRIIFSGDTRQIQSVEAADALRILEKESNLKSTSLTQVQRQTNPDYREAIQMLRRAPARGFEKLEEIGAVCEVPLTDRAQTVEEAYRQTRLRPNAQGLPSEVLVVAPTHEEIDAVTAAIRAARKNAGELGESLRFESHGPLNYTTAQKSDPRNFRPGQILEFHRAVKGVAKNEALEVLRIDAHGITARNVRREERAFTPRQARAFSVYDRQEIEVASGERLLLMANRRGTGFRATNGELVTVDGFDRQGRIRLADGRVLPAHYRQFTYGYAVTAHRSQGKTVDAVVISADAMSQELFYVAASRGRHAITVVTSDKELLRHSIACSGRRQSASELARKAETPGQARYRGGEPRGLGSARHIAPEAGSEDISSPILRSHAIPSLLQQPAPNTQGQSYGYQS
jgi:conjugative relaxase-like TrwC/TraI family protein